MSTNNEKSTMLPMTVTEGLTVNVLPNEQYECLMTRTEVAKGYGANKYSILQALHNHPEDFIKGKHYVLGGDILLPPSSKGLIQGNSILFTKKGIVRLGFFIKSERAKLFRDWAEELIVKVDELIQQGTSFPMQTKQLPKKRNHNRLTSERLIRLLQLTHRIEDSVLRNEIVEQLMGGRE